MQDPLETAELLAFAKTVEAKSLSRAALELGVPRATIGRRLARLEERLGARLLRRTTRSLVLTDAGEALYRHAHLVLSAVRNAEASVRKSDDAPRGDLRISVPPIQTPAFYEMVCNFAAAHPQLRVHLHSSTQQVDMQRAGYDVAVRASTQLEPGLVARTLSRSPLMAVASPGYLTAHGTPRTARDLHQHRCLMGFMRGELPQTHWPLRSGKLLHLEGVLFTNDIALLCNAALRGLGIALLPGQMVQPALERGELVQVLAGIVEAESHVAVVYPEREFVPPGVRAFVNAVLAWAPHEERIGRARSQPRSATTRPKRKR